MTGPPLGFICPYSCASPQSYKKVIGEEAMVTLEVYVLGEEI